MRAEPGYDPALDDDLDGDDLPGRLRGLLDEPPTLLTVAPLSVLDVASAILHTDGPMDTYRLQKLCYYAQAQHLAKHNTRLFHEPIEAWPNGPVVRALWVRHRGRRAVDDLRAGSVQAVQANPAAADTVRTVLADYGSFSGQQLVELTHREQPWRDAREGLSPRQSSSREVPVEALRDYYRGFDVVEPFDVFEQVDD